METMTPMVPLAVVFLLAAGIYSMAGLGGASTYLALLVLAGAPYSSVAPVALVCNLIVTAGSLIQFGRSKLIPVQLILPFIIASIPTAFWGGVLRVHEPTLKIVLAVCLFVAAVYLVNYNRFQRPGHVQVPSSGRLWTTGISVGGLIGFVSGMVGIGGGIFLAPVLYLLRWIDARQIAAASSLFILVNSAAGLSGQAAKMPIAPPLAAALPLFVAVLLGSQIGSVFSARHVRPVTIRMVTAMLVLVASIRIAWTIW